MTPALATYGPAVVFGGALSKPVDPVPPVTSRTPDQSETPKPPPSPAPQPQTAPPPQPFQGLDIRA